MAWPLRFLHLFTVTVATLEGATAAERRFSDNEVWLSFRPQQERWLQKGFRQGSEEELARGLEEGAHAIIRFGPAAEALETQESQHLARPETARVLARLPADLRDLRWYEEAGPLAADTLIVDDDSIVATSKFANRNDFLRGMATQSWKRHEGDPDKRQWQLTALIMVIEEAESAAVKTSLATWKAEFHSEVVKPQETSLGKAVVDGIRQGSLAGEAGAASKAAAEAEEAAESAHEEARAASIEVAAESLQEMTKNKSEAAAADAAQAHRAATPEPTPEVADMETAGGNRGLVWLSVLVAGSAVAFYFYQTKRREDSMRTIGGHEMMLG
eukprot:TRINITY_DN35219_c0_g1_i1.p1 TRINITY_DN35219_c0_g1~~TRINITY_DN35219_c0_g1_i1.p1  ORF type:complete len:329 (-),score=87.26 TRINITY_DN35219_c0_g1_i1:293-1279(-)